MNVNFEPIVRGLIFLTETKCKIRFIYVGFNCKRKKFGKKMSGNYDHLGEGRAGAYLIFVIFFTQAKFLENKIYTEKRQFFALNL